MTGEKNIDELFKDALDNVREVDAEIDAVKIKAQRFGERHCVSNGHFRENC